jgi:hypothetical protein
MRFKIACAGLFSIAFSASAAAGPYDAIWVDLTTDTGPRRIFVNIESITAVADKRTAELMFAEGHSAWPPRDKLEADCSSLTYRLSPTEKWRADDPDNVRRICKKNFAGLRKYYAEELEMRPEILKALLPSGTYLHRKSNTYFPRTLGGFHRTQMVWVSDREDDVQAWYEQPLADGTAKLIVSVFPLSDLYGADDVGKASPDKVRACKGQRSLARYVYEGSETVEKESDDEVKIAGRTYAHFGGRYLAWVHFGIEAFCDYQADRVISYSFELPRSADPAAIDAAIERGPFPGRRLN